jgi:hypothetical protein
VAEQVLVFPDVNRPAMNGPELLAAYEQLPPGEQCAVDTLLPHGSCSRKLLAYYQG